MNIYFAQDFYEARTTLIARRNEERMRDSK